MAKGEAMAGQRIRTNVRSVERQPGLKWKPASTIAEGKFHSGRYLRGEPVLFLTLESGLGYDKHYSVGSDSIEPRKLRQPTPLTGQVGNGTASDTAAVREHCPSRGGTRMGLRGRSRVCSFVTSGSRILS